MKDFPPDVDLRHVKKVKPQSYYTHRFSAVLGGVCKSTQDIMDKILLANSLLDNSKNIFLCGEVGIAALYALGIKVGRVERRKTVEQQHKDYAKLSPFFKRLFEKAAICGCNLVLPHDIVAANRYVRKGHDDLGEGSDPQTGLNATNSGQSWMKEVHIEGDPEREVENKIYKENPEIHWSDVSILSKKHKVIDIEDHVRSRLAVYQSVAQTLQLSQKQLSNVESKVPLISDKAPTVAQMTAMSPG